MPDPMHSLGLPDAKKRRPDGRPKERRQICGRSAADLRQLARRRLGVPQWHRNSRKSFYEGLIQTRTAGTAADHCEVAPVLIEAVELNNERPRVAPVLVRSSQP